MTSKRACLQKVTVTNLNDQKRGFDLNKTIIFGVFTMDNS